MPASRPRHAPSKARRSPQSEKLRTADIARILRISAAAVRAMAHAGLCRPSRRGRLMEFSFQDLVLLRAAVSLRANHVTPQRLRRALRDLARQLPHDRPLSGVRLYADGGEVFVRDGRSAWEPGTGQSVFIFDVDDLARRTRVAPRSRRTTAAPAPGNRGRSRRL